MSAMEQMGAVESGLSLLIEAEQLLSARKLSAALTAFDRVASSGLYLDRCDSGRWLALMLLGQFENAWKQSDRIRARSSVGSDQLWNGESVVDKRVIVRCLHGFGDTVQNMQYAPALSALANHVTWEVPPELVPLATCFEGVENVVTWGEQTPRRPPAWDTQIEVTELPYLFRTQVKQLPIASHYLKLSSAKPKLTCSSGFRVGIVWSAGAWDSSRSIPFSNLDALWAADGIDYWNLQGGAERDDIRCSRVTLRDIRECNDGILSLAAVISQLDLVITVDTLAAHLAGALGVPVWVMLKHAADWRWMVDRDDSPWYPSMRLFRQPNPGDWPSVVSYIAYELQKLRASVKQRRYA